MRFSALRNRAVGAVTTYLDREYDAAELFHAGQETPIIRRHLNQFHSVLFLVSISSALGSYFCFTSIFGRFFAAFLAFAMFRSFCRTASSLQSRRIRIFVYCAFFVWASVTPWFTWFLGIDKGFVVCTMLVTCVSFGTLRLTFEQPSPLSSAVSWGALVLYGLLPGVSLHLAVVAFVGDSDLLMAQLCWWVLCFNVYVALYSQEVVVRASRGDDDHVEHALRLYTDFPCFVIHLNKGLWKLRKGEEG